MTALSPHLRAALLVGDPAILVRIAQAEGSTPREAGATMLVTLAATHGTIGGGQLEFHAIDVARDMIAQGVAETRLDLPLGPHLGQCCGGRVELKLKRAVASDLEALEAAERREASARPHILLFGAGHVGLALARTLALLPFATTLVDDREAPPPPLPETIAFARLDDPETLVHAAAPGSAFVILTHSHALDYRLADAALARRDALYVGMIGSQTKRVRFERWFLARQASLAIPAARETLARLVCPIGGKATRDKRPEVIAALATAEIVAHLLAAEDAGKAARGDTGETGRTGIGVVRIGLSGTQRGRRHRAA
jgi:xanthine dehydrogenase accessory factor